MKSHLIKYAFAYSALVIVVIWGSTPFVMRWLVSECFETMGQAGDMFGAINALFSGLTIAGLIFTIIRQQDEIKESANQFKEEKDQLQKHHEEQKEQARRIFDEQKNQIQRNHEEQKEQTRKIFDEQKDQIQRNFDQEKEYLRRQIRIQNFQRFDYTFFEMIDLHNRIVNNLNQGKDKFQEFNNEYTNKLFHVNSKEYIEEHFNRRIKGVAEPLFGHYLQNLIEIVNIISTKRTKQGRDKYLNILFAQLTKEEVIFLYYYCNITKPRGFDVIENILHEVFILFFRTNTNHYTLWRS